jgi:hypothetical protein
MAEPKFLRVVVVIVSLVYYLSIDQRWAQLDNDQTIFFLVHRMIDSPTEQILYQIWEVDVIKYQLNMKRSLR